MIRIKLGIVFDHAFEQWHEFFGQALPVGVQQRPHARHGLGAQAIGSDGLVGVLRFGGQYVGYRAGQVVDIGDLALACALAYADFRFPELSWRTGQAALNEWYAAFAQRASMRATEFVVPV